MNDFLFYFTEGWKHIISKDAFDHQLFVLTLAVMYSFREWKKVLILITAFTIGHSATLVLSVLNILHIHRGTVEFLIPLTIICTAVWNVAGHKKDHRMNLNYFLALFFGLIHGLGFAETIRVMLAGDQSLALGILGFNTGLEAGQVLVVLIILLMTKLIVDLVRVPQKTYTVVVSLMVAVLSVNIAWNRFPYVF